MFHRAVKMAPDSSAARHALGVTSLVAGNYQEAIGALKEAIQLDPDNGSYHLSLAQAYENANHIEDSLSEYEAFLELAPDDPRAEKIARLVDRAKKALDERRSTGSPKGDS